MSSVRVQHGASSATELHHTFPPSCTADDWLASNRDQPLAKPCHEPSRKHLIFFACLRLLSLLRLRYITSKKPNQAPLLVRAIHADPLAAQLLRVLHLPLLHLDHHLFVLFWLKGESLLLCSSYVASKEPNQAPSLFEPFMRPFDCLIFACPSSSMTMIATLPFESRSSVLFWSKGESDVVLWVFG